MNDTTSGATGPPPAWLFVAGHYPVFSVGTNGDTDELQTYLQPLLERYKVDAYFSGHDHMSEHLQRNGVDYFVAGAGAMTDTARRTSKGQLVWAGENYAAFGIVEVTSQSFRVSFIDAFTEKRYVVAREKSPAPAARRPTSGPVVRPSAQPSSAPTSEPTSQPSQAPIAHVSASTGSADKDDRSILAIISKLFVDGSRSPIVLAAGGVFGASMMLLLVYAAYSRGGKSSYKAVVVAPGEKAQRKSAVSGRLAMVALRGEASGGANDEDDGDDGRDEEEGHPGGGHQFLYRQQAGRRIERGFSDPPSLKRAAALAGGGGDRGRERRSLNPSVAAHSSGAASYGGSSPSDLTQSGDGDGIRHPELHKFESELRLKLFDVIAHSITSEDVRAGTTDGRLFQKESNSRGGAISSPSHRRAVTVAVV